MWVRFPPFPPSRCGREVRRGPEKPVTYVRFVATAPEFYAGGRPKERTADCGSADTGSTPVHRTILLLRRGWQAIAARFPPFPPSRCGREVRRGAEKPVTYGRFVATAPEFYAGGRPKERTADCGSADTGSTPVHRTILLLRSHN